MKIVLFAFSVFVAITAFSYKPGLSKKERKAAISYLKETKKLLSKNIKGLSEAQLTYRTAPDRWSVEECVKHIAAAEEGLWKTVEAALNAAPNPEKRGEIKTDDEGVKSMVTNRSVKAQAPEPFQPKNITYKTAAEAFAAFETNRNKLVDYVKHTTADMRNYVLTLPFASFDAYQMVIFIAAHSRRHTLQIEEVMADSGFPKQ